ncbi:inovirus Gp2 family protein, partial [Pseudomonas aeruginosa]|nr:inovirus Gp2 family protein [Pseudomonas aeruginosa]
FIGKLGGWGRGILPNQKVFFRVSLVSRAAGDHGELADLFHRASYLCKAATKSYGDGQHGFGCSRY